VILHLICEFRTLPRMCAVDRTLRIALPIPGTYSTPTAETTVKFTLRGSDTLNETGIAILNHYDAFLGRIKERRYT
jgi:hypothetical protein